VCREEDAGCEKLAFRLRQSGRAGIRPGGKGLDQGPLNRIVGPLSVGCHTVNLEAERKARIVAATTSPFLFRGARSGNLLEAAPPIPAEDRRMLGSGSVHTIQG